jgi:hypothetical protein
MTQEEEKALQALLLDDDWPSCLNEWLYGVNIFDVLKVSRTEIRHSNMLAWLLDPRESHGFGTAFLDGFLKRICKNADVDEKTPFLIANWENATVSREWGTEKRRLDILVECRYTSKKSLVLAIENKIDSKDGNGQLDAYYKEILKEFPCEYNRGRHLFVYLTPDGDDPASDIEADVWIRLSYADIVSILDELMTFKVQMPQNLRELLHDYRSLIRREIMTDFNLDKCCNAIYRKHKEAFDLVLNHADMSGAVGEARSAIKKFLQEKCKQSNGELIFTGDRKGTQSVLSFQSKAMNSCLSQLPSGTKGSWMNEDVYYYWFDVNRYNGRIRLIVEFGLMNLSTSLHDSMMMLGKIINSKKSLQEGKYRRVKPYFVGAIEDDFDYDTFIPKVVATITKLKEDERKWLTAFHGKQERTEQ